MGEHVQTQVLQHNLGSGWAYTMWLGSTPPTPLLFCMKKAHCSLRSLCYSMLSALPTKACSYFPTKIFWENRLSWENPSQIHFNFPSRKVMLHKHSFLSPQVGHTPTGFHGWGEGTTPKEKFHCPSSPQKFMSLSSQPSIEICNSRDKFSSDSSYTV